MPVDNRNMKNEATTITTKLAEVEDGFARVLDADTGRAIGHVTREKAGSSRTGTAWLAFTATGRELAKADTREQAITIVRQRTEQVRAWKASQA